MRPNGSLLRRSLVGLSAALVAAAIAVPAGVQSPAGAATLAGSQGTDTALPATSSVRTLNGRGTFAGLSVTINQTADLNNQAVSVTWSGGTPTRQGPGRFGAHFLQIFQCWGDADSSVPSNPGPPPEQCVQGAAAGTYGGLSGASIPNGFATSRIVSRSTWDGYNAADGFTEAATSNVWRPFRSVNETVVNSHVDPNFNPSVSGGSYWLNSFFNIVTTNEIAAASTGADGRGAELFEVHTGLQSAGLGCGQRVQRVAGSDSKAPTCWLVIVPRGEPSVENVGTPFADDPTTIAINEANSHGVVTSPLTTSAWQNRIAVELSFNPVDAACALGRQERRITGSELALSAIASWQPTLCGIADLPPYSFVPVSDSSARLQLLSTASGAPGMIVTSRPISPALVNPAEPVVYSPLAVSGITIGFNIERNPRTDSPEDAQALAGVRVGSINLTPRLVAKLLTQSYQAAVTIQAAPDYPWMTANPVHLGLDPDFLRFNPEFALLSIADSRTFSSLQLPSGSSDSARLVWEWIFADPEARAFLGGQPDEWGMQVNPAYSTDAATNPAGVGFGDPLPTSYPKADPYCFQGEPRGSGTPIVPPLLCTTDWVPYTRGFSDSARIARVAFDAARVVDNPFAVTASQVWVRDVPQYLGRRAMLTLTDTPSAAQYGLQTARLSRAGDTGAERQFVAADTAGLAAGVSATTPSEVPSVLIPDHQAAVAGAYPLTTISYAALSPLSLDAQERSDFAALLDYARNEGQRTGSGLGQLPTGYLPLTAGQIEQATRTAADVRTMVPATTTTTTVPPTTASTSPAPVPTAAPRSGGTTATPTARPTTTSPPPSATTLAPVADTAPVDVTAGGPDSTVPLTTVADAGNEPVSARPTPLTQITAVGRARYFLVGLAVVALLASYVSLEISRRPRRAAARAGAM
jgi:hypothetical protein